jgi:hypothetical protein
MKFDMRLVSVRLRLFACAAVLVLLLPSYAQAYIGPGAGFALAGSFLAVFGAIFSAVVMIISWPIRRILRFLFRRKPPEPPRFKRVVVLGLDGLDHGLTKKRSARRNDAAGRRRLTLKKVSDADAWSSAAGRLRLCPIG